MSPIAQMSALKQYLSLHQPLVQAVRQAGGRFIWVGGAVRDALRGEPPKDFDAEVYGLSFEALNKVLQKFAPVHYVGKSFGVFYLSKFNVEIALPRRDNKTAKGHRGFKIEIDPALTFEECAKRRDLTINSMGYDPFLEKLLDPFNGQRDLRAGILRAVDPQTFREDPLRALRVAQFAARFCMTPDESLVQICRQIPVEELSGDRIRGELEKILTKGKKPSLAFEFLDQTSLIKIFPEMKALKGIPQNPFWHPEGDVWTHTMMVIDSAAVLMPPDKKKLLMMAALTHDFGKATCPLRDGKISGHEKSGALIAKNFLSRFGFSKQFIRQVCLLIQYHLIPRTPGKPLAYRLLAHRFLEEGLGLEDLAWVSRADMLGRTSAEALRGEAKNIDLFLKNAIECGALDVENLQDKVTGKDLILRGFPPGPAYQAILSECRVIQYETGLEDAEKILDLALGKDL